MDVVLIYKFVQLRIISMVSDMFVMIIEYKSLCSFLDDQNISKQFEHKL